MRSPPLPARSLYSDHPVALEATVLVLALTILQLWVRTTTTLVTAALPGSGAGTWDVALVGPVTYLCAVAVFVAAYATFRGIELPLSRPVPANIGVVALVSFVPPALVVLTDIVAGALFGTQYSTLVQVRYAEAATAELFVRTALPRVAFVAVSMGLVVHGVVQRTLARVLSDRQTVAATTFLAVLAGVGFASPVAVLTATAGGIALSVLFMLAVATALYATERARRRPVRYLGYVPLGLLGIGVVQTLVTDLTGVPSVLFLVATIAVYGLAAFAYDATESVWIPALAYATFELTGELVAFALEAGTVLS